MALRQPTSWLLALALTLLGIVASWLQTRGIPLVGVLALPLVLFLPGYAFTRVLFAPTALGSAERALLSAALSLAVTILGGLLLNLTLWGLQFATWLILLGSITIICLLWSGFRDRTVQPKNQLAELPSIHMGDVFFVGCALIAVVAALGIAQMPVPADRVQGYTTLWVLPATRAAPVTFGMTSQETAPVTYRLELRANDHVVQTWDSVALQPGAAWTNSFQGTLPSGELEARLYRLDQPNTPYRTVHIQTQ